MGKGDEERLRLRGGEVRRRGREEERRSRGEEETRFFVVLFRFFSV